jgi:tetratricopeptide (TPR) repeat protein
MWRRPVLTIVLLIIAVILTLPLRAQQQIVAAPATAGLARAYVAASLPRHGGVKPPLRPAVFNVSATAQGISPAKPFTQEQVSNMVRDGFGDESGAKLIEQRGIDFAPSEDFTQTLKAAGASEAFIKALRATKPPEPASAKKPLNQAQVFALLVGQVSSHRVTMLVQERGIDFEPTDEYLQEVRLAGGEDELISALESAKVTKPATVDPAAQARQVEVRQHVASGAEYFKKGQYADAEAEYRAAVRLDPENADLHVCLGIARGTKGDTDGEIAECREALRLNPKNEDVRYNLGGALGRKGDWDGMIAEEREALRLNPNNAGAHRLLGFALEHKHDPQEALQEYRAAYELNPHDPDYRKDYERLLQQVNK